MLGLDWRWIMYFKAEIDTEDFAPRIARIKRRLGILAYLGVTTFISLAVGLGMYLWMVSRRLDSVRAEILSVAMGGAILFLGVAHLIQACSVSERPTESQSPPDRLA